jgi:hypothetical protein
MNVRRRILDEEAISITKTTCNQPVFRCSKIGKRQKG